MGKGKEEGPDFEESAARVLAGLMERYDAPGVTKAVDAEGVAFTVAAGVMPSRMQGLLVLDLKYAAPSIVEMFFTMADELGIPAEEWLEFAEDRAAVMLMAMLQRAQETLGDMLQTLIDESFLMGGHLCEHGDEKELPPVRGEIARAAGKLAESAAKKRFQARGRGAEAGVSFVDVCATILRHGGEDAQAKDVARVLGVSARQLYNIQRAAGYSGAGGWRDFTGYVAGLFDRK